MTDRPQPDERLDSWKEIASYLKRDVRTVQRWEKLSGLPIHRLRLGKSGAVHAYRSELDVWWNQRRVEIESIDSTSRPARHYTVWIAAAATLTILSLIGIVLVRGRTPKAPKTPILNALAVLPLENLTGDESQEYFSDGMTDALITQLAQIPGLRVISRTSTIQYKETKKPLPEIARELNVDAIVEGTVTRGNGRAKITAQLIYAPSDAHLWAGSVTGSTDDLLQLQQDVVTKITSKIEERLTSGERVSALKVSATSSTDAYEEYLKGVYFYNRRTPEDIKTGMQHLQSAITKDPSFAPAYARLAYCYVFLGASDELSFEAWSAPARHFAERATRLDSDLDEAHLAAAIVARADWDWPKAEVEYRRAIQLNPNYAFARLGYSQLLLITGRIDESANEARGAKALDPISVDSKLGTVTNAYFRRQYEEGLAEVRAAIELYPQIPAFHVFLANFLLAEGNYESAAKEILEGEELGGATAERMAALRAANLAAGLKGMRRKRIQLNKRTGEKSTNAYDIAIDCAAVGDTREALNWLEKSIQARDQKVMLMGVEPIFDNLHPNPRFIALLNRVGLEARQN